MGTARYLSPEEADNILTKIAPVPLDTSDYNRKFLDCRFGKDPEQALDLYLPTVGGGPFPVILYLHGGGWIVGSRADTQVLPFLDGLSRGYAVVSCGYRLAPDSLFPDNLFDVKSALSWIADNASEFSLDSSRVAIAGSSAGAHLALLAAFTDGIAVYEGAPLGSRCGLKAVVSLYGPSDLSKLFRHFEESGYPRFPNTPPIAPEAVEIMLGAKCSDIPNYLRFASPIYSVHPDIPPVLIQQGLYDPIIPYQQALELTEKIYDVAGKERVRLNIFDDYTHADPRFANRDNIERIFAFLDPLMLAR